jgi:hypothetical protein
MKIIFLIITTKVVPARKQYVEVGPKWELPVPPKPGLPVRQI